MPDYKLENLARVLLPAIQKFYETEEAQREFAEWQKQRQLNKKSKNNCSPVETIGAPQENT